MVLTSIILAAGKGTRMNSALSKVMHPICGKPLVSYAVQNAFDVGAQKTVVVVGHSAQAVQRYLGDRVEFAYQAEQLGTGHAVQAAKPNLKNESGLILVMFGDMPLFRRETIQAVVNTQQANDGPLTMLTVVAKDARGFGRIIRNDEGKVKAIVEEAQATPEQRLIQEVNASVYCFEAGWLWQALENVPLSPKGEYYLTDVVEIAVSEGRNAAVVTADDEMETLGINTRVHLAEAEAVMRRRILEQLMLSGVTMIDPASTYVDAGVSIGMDTVIQPNTFIYGSTVIGENCTIGPNTIITDTKIGNRCSVLASMLEKAELEDDVDMGPFARLRKGAHLANHVHIGNFGEVKDSYLGEGTKMGHFSYIGNAAIGKDVNIGAGTITCNYDGQKKHQTVIGDDVFIGSDTMLVAPVTIGAGAKTGAGAVVTKDVPEGKTVVGMPAKELRKLNQGE